jgi:hypothetical protein
MAVAILLWLTDFIHHISPSIVGIGIGLFALLPRVWFALAPGGELKLRNVHHFSMGLNN